MKNSIIITFIILFAGLVSCTKDASTFNNTGTSLPSLRTDSVTNITNTTATAGGNVLTGGTTYVSGRGVCWSTTTGPTVDDDITANGSGIGAFTSALTGLLPGLAYYVRAYAINSTGDVVYGNEVNFRTTGVATINFATLTTTAISNITATSADIGGDITSDGGSPVTARGVCWSTSTGPTTADSKTINGNGVGSFSSSMTGLTTHTTYYVRAYATNGVGTAYGNEISFTTN